MIRFLLCGAALAAAALPVSASAQLGDKLDCAVDHAEPGFRHLLAEALIGDGDNSSFDRLMAQFSVIADGCTAGFALDAAQKKAYLDYGVSRILHEWLITRLASYGLPAAIIDQTLDFGPGHINPSLSGGMGEEHVQILVQAFMESGIDTESIKPSAWETVGTYAALSSIYWRQRQQLSLWPVTAIPAPAAADAVTPGPVAPEPAPAAAIADPAPTQADAAPTPEPAPQVEIATPPPADEKVNPVQEPPSEAAIAAPPVTEASIPPAPDPESAMVAPPPAEAIPAGLSEPTLEPVPSPTEASPAPEPGPTPEPAAVTPLPAEAAPAPSPEPAPPAEVRSSPER